MQHSQSTAAPAGHAQTAESGLGRPFRWAPRDVDVLPLQVRGSVPEWLRGQLVRTAPAVFERGGVRVEHWFDGHGLVYAFELGPQPRYKQHLLETRIWAENGQGQAQIATFDTGMQRGLLRRIVQPIPRVTDNANVNIIPWQGDWLAMTEAPHQHVIDPDSLRSRGLYEYSDNLSKQLTMSAHPHFDRSRNALVNVGTSFGPKSELLVYRQSWASHARELEGRIALKRVPYLHSFGLSERHAVLIDHPFSVNPLRMLFSNKGYIEHFAWQPERGTRLYKLERATGRFTTYETEPLFCFHTVNTYEEGADVLFDFLAYDDPTIIQQLRLEQLEQGLPMAMPRLVRARLTPAGGRVQLEQLSSTPFDLPQIAYRRYAGLPHGHVWGVALAREGDGWSSEIVHVRLAGDRSARFAESGVVLCEPVFVAKPGGQREGEGVLLAVGTRRDADRSVLLVLDAESLEVMARCEVEAAIPLGFHGNWAFNV